MKFLNNNDFLICIENLSNQVAAVKSREIVDWILKNHGATSVEDLNPSEYSDVYSELYFYLND